MCPFFIIMRSCDILGTCTIHHSTKNDNFTEGVNSLASNSLLAGSLGEREPARIPMMIACRPSIRMSQVN